MLCGEGLRQLLQQLVVPCYLRLELCKLGLLQAADSLTLLLAQLRASYVVAINSRQRCMHKGRLSFKLRKGTQACMSI